MRNIKFRAWDKEDKKMYQVAHINNLLTVGKYVSVRKNEDNAIVKIERDLEEDSFELMQFTGEVSRDKKEVYEGDIIEYRFEDGGAYSTPMKGVVKFSQGRFECPYGIGEVVIFRVLGNIYENAGLIK